MLFQAQYALGVLRLLTADRQIRSSVGSSALEAERASSLLGQAISHPRDTRVEISGSLGGTDCFWNGRANGHYSSVHASEEVFVRASRRSLFVPPRRSSFMPPIGKRNRAVECAPVPRERRSSLLLIELCWQCLEH